MVWISTIGECDDLRIISIRIGECRYQFDRQQAQGGRSTAPHAGVSGQKECHALIICSVPVCRQPPFLMQTLIDFMDGRVVHLSTSLPSISFPDGAFDDEMETQTGASFFTKSQRRALFDTSLRASKYGRALASFLFIDAKSVVLRDGWLRTLHVEKTKANQSVFGYLRYCVLSGEALSSVLVQRSLVRWDGMRTIISEEVFKQRSDNPFSAVKDIAAGAAGDPCFGTPWLSAYDLPFEVLCFALLMRHRYGPDIKMLGRFRPGESRRIIHRL